MYGPQNVVVMHDDFNGAFLCMGRKILWLYQTALMIYPVLFESRISDIVNHLKFLPP